MDGSITNKYKYLGVVWLVVLTNLFDVGKYDFIVLSSLLPFDCPHNNVKFLNTLVL